jgi:hypothetical protein
MKLNLIPRLLLSVLPLILAILLRSPSAGAQSYGESPYIFGVHDPAGATHMSDKGKRGWILFTEELGRDAANAGGRDYRPWSDAGYGIIVRLNHGYGPTNGTIPYSKHYSSFAQRAANFVRSSPGAHIWIVGNEMNWDQEWPRYEGPTEEITPELYAACFRQVRNAVKSLPGHSGDQVIPGALGTYGPPTPSGGWGFVEYHLRVLELLGQGGVDGIAVHTYTHGADPQLIFDESLMGPPYQSRHYNFRAYRDYLNAHPAWARSLPVYVTETDQVGPWTDANRGWVRNAYREIDDWNRTAGKQKIRALCLYRFCCDQWDITGKGGVIDDFRQAMDNDYRWTTTANCFQGVASDHWKGEYFPGIDLLGSPTAVADEGAGFLAFDWGSGGPGRCGIGSDRFSARFTRTLSFAAGTYRFVARVDDGVRLYVDGRLQLDRWFDQAPTSYTVDVPLAAGEHSIEFHYYENGGGATLGLEWSSLGGLPDDAEIVEAESSVPSSLGPGETRSIRVRVRNSGTKTWNAGEPVRLGAGPTGNVAWRNFACGGYGNAPSDARAYLCQSVSPGASHDFRFEITAPSSGVGRFAVRMVRDGVHWFGEDRTWSIPIAAAPPLAADVLETQSAIPASLAPGETRSVTVRIQNTGSSTWTAGEMFRLGAGSSNTVTWESFPCGGFSNSVTDARAYLCSPVAPNGVYDFTFNVTAPQNGPAVLSVQMVKELVAWFGERRDWSIPQGSSCSQSPPADRWKGEYFSNTVLSGPPALTRDDGGGFLSFDFGTGSPGSSCGVGVDLFSARWTRTVVFTPGTYRFTARSDDGIRVFVDNVLHLDKWILQAPTTYSFDVNLNAGSHTLRMEFYENLGGAVAQISWAKLVDGGASASKLTLHTGFTGPLSMQFIERAKPRIVKILDNFGPAAQVKALSPATLIIGRIYEPSQPQDGDPGARAQEWWSRNRNRIVAHPAVDYWEGYNEPGVASVDSVRWYAEHEAARVRLLAANGKKACIGNFSTGTPDVTNPAMWPAFYPAIDAARQHGGILGLHEYGTPMQQYFDEGSREGWLCGRYRKVYRQHLVPDGRVISMAVTETGVDGVPPVGWKNHYTGDQYLSQLKWYDALLRQDDYVLGATIFALEIPGWEPFDIAPLVDPLSAYVAASR